MYFSRKLLAWVAALSALAAVALAVTAPASRRIAVLKAQGGTLRAGEPVHVGENVAETRIPLGDYARSPESYVPASLAALLDSRRAVREIASGAFLSAADVLPLSQTATTGDVTYTILSSRLTRDQRAITVPSSSITSSGGALEPGDRVDIYLPGVDAIRDVELLAVGTRIQGGWVSSSEGIQRDTITLALSPGAADALAGVLMRPGTHPVIVLRPRPSSSR